MTISTSFARVQAPAEAEADVSAAAGARAGSALRRWSFIIHKYAGLTGALWIAVLGLTGFFLDHPVWLNQSYAPAWLTTDALRANAQNNLFKLYQAEPGREAHLVAGGPRGLWTSDDAGVHWRETRFPGGAPAQILAIEPDPALGWKRLWFGADDGLYVSDDGGDSARPVGLAGQFVSSLAADFRPDHLLAVVDRSRALRVETDAPDHVEALDFAPPPPDQRPPQVGLNRFLRELHFGRGLFESLASLVLNDIGGLAMLVLPLSGLLYWGLPKIWKAQARRKDRPRTSKHAKKMTIRWLYNLHGVVVGLGSLLLIVYLCVSGALLGHLSDLGAWMRATQIAQAYLPPAFAFHSWDGAIESLATVPGDGQTLALGAREGLYLSADGGKTWRLERDGEGKPYSAALHLRRIGDALLIANSMAAPSLIREKGVTRDVMDGPGGGMGDHAGHHHGAGSGSGGGAGWHGPQIAGQQTGRDMMANMFMPLDVTPIGDTLAWKNGGRLFVTDREGKKVDFPAIHLPDETRVPWQLWFLRLHMGTIFWSQWRWVNDAFSILALVLWQRQKWA